MYNNFETVRDKQSISIRLITNRKLLQYGLSIGSEIGNLE